MDVLHLVLLAVCVVVGVLVGFLGARYSASGKQALESKIPDKGLADWVFDLGQSAFAFVTKEEPRILEALKAGKSVKEIGKLLLADFESFLGGPFLAGLRGVLPFAVQYFDHFLLGHLGTALGEKLAGIANAFAHQSTIRAISAAPATTPAQTPSSAPAQAAAQVVALAPPPASSSEVPRG